MDEEANNHDFSNDANEPLQKQISNTVHQLSKFLAPRILSTLEEDISLPQNLEESFPVMIKVGSNRQSKIHRVNLADFCEKLRQVRQLFGNEQVLCAFELPKGDANLVVRRREFGVKALNVFLCSEFTFLQGVEKPHHDVSSSKSARMMPPGSSRTAHLKTGTRYASSLRSLLRSMSGKLNRFTYTPLAELEGNSRSDTQTLEEPSYSKHAIVDFSDESIPLQPSTSKVSSTDRTSSNAEQNKYGSMDQQSVETNALAQDVARLPMNDPTKRQHNSPPAQQAERAPSHNAGNDQSVEYYLCCAGLQRSQVLEMLLTVATDVADDNGDVKLTCPDCVTGFLGNIFGAFKNFGTQSKSSENGQSFFGSCLIKSLERDGKNPLRTETALVQLTLPKRTLKHLSHMILILQNVYGTGISNLLDLAKIVQRSSREGPRAFEESCFHAHPTPAISSAFQSLEKAVSARATRKTPLGSFFLQRSTELDETAMISTWDDLHRTVEDAEDGKQQQDEQNHQVEAHSPKREQNMNKGERQQELERHSTCSWEIKSRKKTLNDVARQVGIDIVLEICDNEIDISSRPPHAVFHHNKVYRVLWHTGGRTVIKKEHETQFTGAGVKVRRKSFFMWLSIFLGFVTTIVYVIARSHAIDLEDLIRTAATIAALYGACIVPLTYYVFYEDENIHDVLTGRAHLDTRKAFDKLDEEERLHLCIRSLLQPESDRKFIDKHNSCYATGGVTGAAMRVNYMPCIGNLLVIGFIYWETIDNDGALRRGLVSPSGKVLELERMHGETEGRLHAVEIDLSGLSRRDVMNLIETKDCPIEKFYVGFNSPAT